VTVPIRPASTVALLRDGIGGLDVFLVRRHHDMAFMGGAYVFPGGRVEASDRRPQWLAFADDVAVAAAAMPDVDLATAIGFHVAAVRETFEEAGVLLARYPGGVTLAPGDGADLPAQRRALNAGTTDLLELFQEHRWRLEVTALAYVAHWVTPEIETHRFDTRFFLAALPTGQVPVHDATETTDGMWTRPADAIARCRGGTIVLPPPTWTTLRWLEALPDVASALAWAREKRVPRIEPGFVRRGDARIVTLPGDPTLPAVDGFETKETRFLLENGRWTPINQEREGTD
jgi:8-oxo-dGTP pyrophosphatase MutT (NUDIX family)